VIDWLRRHPHRAALLFLALLPMSLLWPCLVGKNTYVPYDLAQFSPVATKLTLEQWQQTRHNDNTDVTEIPVMFGPQLEFIRSELHAGRAVHWDPYSRSGTPMWASSILGVMYPLNWPLFFGFDPYFGFALSAYTAFLIASMLMYGFLVHLGLTPLAALFGAIAFAYSGTLTINSHFYQRINALIWLPGILWAMRCISHRRGRQRLPAMLGLALCMFMTMTAGFPPFALVVTFVAVAYTGWLLVHEWRLGGGRASLSLAVAVGAAALLGLLAAAAQLLPMAEFFPVSNRNIQVSGNGIAFIGFNWYGLLGYLMPDLFSHPHLNEIGKLPDAFSPLAWYLQSGTRWEDQVVANGTLPPGSYFQPNYNFCEYTVFVGVATMFLAIVGAWAGGQRFRKFAVGALVGLMLLATASWWMSWLLSLSPFRWVPPMRYTGPTCMLMAALAAMGLEALPRLPRRPRIVLVAAGLLAAVVCLVFWLWVNAHSEAEILQAMLPTLSEKYAPELGVQLPGSTEKVITLEGAAKYLGPSMPVARQHMLWNLAYAGWLLAGCAVVLAALPWVGRLRHRVRGLPLLQLLPVLAIGVLLAELLHFGIPLNRGRDLQHSHHTEIHDFLVEQRDKHAATGGFTVMRAASVVRSPIIPAQLPGGTLLNYRIRDLQAYTFVDGLSHKPFLKLYGPRYMARLYWPVAFPDDERLELPYFDLLGVRFVLAEDRLTHAGTSVGPEWQAPPDQPWRYAGGEFFVYERDSALPSAFVVHDFRTVFGDDEHIIEEHTIEALIDKDLTPLAYCLLDPTTAARLTIDLDGNPPRSATLGNDRPVTFPGFDRTNHMRFTVAAGEPGYLVLNHTCLPGWSATVNGVPTPIYRTNLFMSMVPVGADDTVVELSYITPGYRAGFWVTVLSFVVMAALAVLALLARRSRPPARDAEVPL
jgi:hypothetical protein